MNKPTVLRNSAEPEVVIGIALKIYYNQNDWVSNAKFIEQLDLEYDAIGKEREPRNGGQLIAKYKPALYYGLLDCRPEDECKRINEYGRKYYEAYLAGNQDQMVDCLLHAISVQNFGRGNAAVPKSDSSIEPPKVYLVASLLLNGLSRVEYAYILEQLSNDRSFQVVLVDVIVARQLGKELALSDYAKNNYGDDKGIKFMADAGLFEEKGSMRIIKSKYVLQYAELFRNLSIFNDEQNSANQFNEPFYDETNICEPNQVIYFGAPGTGKSHTVKGYTKDLPEGNVFRTTFHPDSDYSTFVGSYKPTKEKRPVRNVAGDIVKQNGQEVYEEAITYNYIPQAFTKAYVRAWQTDQPVFLVIEEINRGNCAQIFGDLFQLLDRKNNISEYPIKPDHDLGSYISEQFRKFGCVASEDSAIFKGEELCLPANLYIWATMNTSDQSLFPIDSAFKRRWEWRYIKIAKPINKETGNPFDWHIEGNTDWWQFLKKINAIINKMTNSADKQLGYFFAKADDAGEIKYDRFVAKVCFYLWNDIFKTYAMDDVETDLFKYKYQDEDGQEKIGKLNFTEFFDENGKVVPGIVQQFIENVMKWNDNSKQE